MNILDRLPLAHRQHLALLSHYFSAAVRGMPIRVKLLLTLCRGSSGDEQFPLSIGGSRFRWRFGNRGADDDNQDEESVWTAWGLDVSSSSEEIAGVDKVLEIVRKGLEKQYRRKFILALGHLEIATRTDRTYPQSEDLDAFMNKAATKLILNVAPTNLTLHNPPPETLSSLPSSESLTTLSLSSIHTQLNLTPLTTSLYTSLTTLHLRSDGRFLDRRGIIRSTSLQPLQVLANTLTTLTLSGPWLHEMIDDPLSAIRTLSRLINLHTLLADFEPRLHTPSVIANLIKTLPNLRSLGRLGFVDRSFWRLFNSHEARHLTHIALGTRKEPFSSSLSHYSPNFLTDMALGILFLFPAVETLEVWMAFQGDLDTLLNVLKRLLEGGLRSDSERKSHVKKLSVYQALDVGNVDVKGWRFAVEVMGASRGLKAEIRSGAGLGSKGEEVRVFGR